jgi:chloramphenicol O-acetyltransferase type A
MGEYLDLERWKRRDHFQFYRRLAQPFFSVATELDATALWRRCRRKDGPSFFLSAMWATVRAANLTEALRLRMRDDRVWRHDRVAIGTTILRDDETFAFAEFHPDDDFGKFCSDGTREIVRARTTEQPLATTPDDHLIYHSTLPWIRFTSFTNARGAGDSIPRIVVGKCSPVLGDYRLPVAVEVHHALVDGLDVGRFFQNFEREMADCAKL